MSYTAPEAKVIANPVLIDREIKDIQTQMAAISWIDKSFGRAFKHFRLVQDSKVSYPAIYQGKGKDYYDAYPNDHLKAYSFVFVDPSSVAEFNVKRLHSFEQDLSVIVFFDLQEIDTVLDYRFTEKLKEDVIFALSSLTPNRLKINNITDDVEDSFSDFTPSEIKAEFLQDRFGAFKFECTSFYQNDNCELNTFTP